MKPFELQTELKLKKHHHKDEGHQWKKLFLAALSLATILVFLILGA